MRSQAETLEHGPLLLEGIVIAFATTEPIPEILVVLVIRIGLFRVNASFGIRLWVDAQVAGAGLGVARGAAIAREVSLGEDLDERVVAMALDRARIAHAGAIIRF
jgi:hypothetical protein